MSEKARVEFESLFLPDTQAARLEAEQSAFRAALITADRSDRADRNDRADLPFNAFPPICPIEADPAQAGDCAPTPLSIGPAISIDGWIARPVFVETTGNIQAVTVSPVPYPSTPLPESGALILLGYAGDRAEALIATLGAGPALAVRVWYRARFTLEIARSKRLSLAASWKIGPERWIKRERGKESRNSPRAD